jgi:hypothetical protein
MNPLLESLRERTGSLFGINVFGVITWVVESTNVVGLLAALVGLAAGIMLVAIRWSDFVASKPVQWVKARWASRKQGMD